MSDWKHYLVTRVETEEQIVSRIENAAELVPEPAFDYAVREIEAAQKEIERLQSELKAANDDADRLASELGYFLSENGEVFYDISPALIAHKARMVDATKMIHGGHNE